jgi:hypothetical protein
MSIGMGSRWSRMKGEVSRKVLDLIEELESEGLL